MGDPCPIHNPEYKKSGGFKKADLLREFKIKKLSLEQYITPEEINLEPRRGPHKGWSIPSRDINNSLIERRRILCVGSCFL